MTLIVGLRGTDGIVLAADSRGTFGDPRGVTAQNDTQQKVFTLSRHVGVLIAGAGELGSLLVRDATQLIGQQGLDGVTPVMGVFRTLLVQRYQEYFPGFAIQPMPGIAAPQRPSIAAILAGYDLNAAGQPETPNIYSLISEQNFAPMLHAYGFALQGIAQYALYLLNRLYTADRSITELLPLAAYVITETASQDGKVGGPVNILSVTPTGGCALVSESEVQKVQDDNSRRSDNLRKLFFEGS